MPHLLPDRAAAPGNVPTGGVNSWLSKIAAVATTLVVACAGVAACSPGQRASAEEYGCELASPAIKVIALALKVAPQSAVASIGLDSLGITLSEACKHALEKDTEPKSADEFLRSDPNVPARIQDLVPPHGAVCDDANGPTGSVISGRIDRTGPTPITTCAFSRNVRDAFAASGARTPVDVTAWSPAMRRNYVMHCEGDYPVTCRGGDHALVLIY